MAIIEDFDLGANYISPEDFEKFLSVIPKLPCYHMDNQRPALEPWNLELFFQIEYYCALRVSEVINLQWSDIELDRKILIVRKAKTGKNQKTTIPPPLVHILKDCKERVTNEWGGVFSNWLFLSNRGGKLVSRQTIGNLAKEAGYLAELDVREEQDKRSVEGIWTHLFRKSYGKWMRSKGASIELVATKLRHKLGGGRTGPITFTYTKPDINAVLAWEKRIFSES